MALRPLSRCHYVFFCDEPWASSCGTFVRILNYFCVLLHHHGVIGTTIAVHVFLGGFRRVEGAHRHIPTERPALTARFMKLLRIDNFLGMLCRRLGHGVHRGWRTVAASEG